jgi:small subunit ribosomal protein S21
MARAIRAKIDLFEDETIESALKRFKRAQDAEEVLKSFREKEFFEKPSLKRHQAKVRNKRRIFLKNKEHQESDSKNVVSGR